MMRGPGGSALAGLGDRWHSSGGCEALRQRVAHALVALGKELLLFVGAG